MFDRREGEPPERVFSNAVIDADDHHVVVAKYMKGWSVQYSLSRKSKCFYVASGYTA